MSRILGGLLRQRKDSTAKLDRHADKLHRRVELFENDLGDTSRTQHPLVAGVESLSRRFRTSRRQENQLGITSARRSRSTRPSRPLTRAWQTLGLHSGFSAGRLSRKRFLRPRTPRRERSSWIRRSARLTECWGRQASMQTGAGDEQHRVSAVRSSSVPTRPRCATTMPITCWSPTMSKALCARFQIGAQLEPGLTAGDPGGRRLIRRRRGTQLPAVQRAAGGVSPPPVSDSLLGETSQELFLVQTNTPSS